LIRTRISFARYHVINTRHSRIIKVGTLWAICCGSDKGHNHLDATVKDVRLDWIADVSCWVSENTYSAVLTASVFASSSGTLRVASTLMK
jgi:hypothetical protein